MTNIVLFNNDFRLADNQAFYNACKDDKIIPVFILDEGYQSYGSANKVWLSYALNSLDKSLKNKLIILKQNYKKALFNIIEETNAKAVYWNRCYEPKMINLFKEIKQELTDKNIESYSYNSSLLYEPQRVLKNDDTFYKVYTAFYKKAITLSTRKVLPKPTKIEFAEHDIKSLKIEDLNLLPTIKWDKKLIENKDISEQGALDVLNDFIAENGIANYANKRDIPKLKGTSYLSVYLRFGQISPNQVLEIADKQNNSTDFIKQLIWRDFAYYISYHSGKNMAKDNFNSKFDNWQWTNNKEHLKAWQQGKTGSALVDAGMRELFETGYMHNRVRMVAASFLIKNLNIDWRIGEQWFFDCLLDADVAINTFSWQWVAGSGCDAAPYFRVFNPERQIERFDKDHTYIKQYVAEFGTIKYPQKPIVDIAATASLAKQRYSELS